MFNQAQEMHTSSALFLGPWLNLGILHSVFLFFFLSAKFNVFTTMLTLTFQSNSGFYIWLVTFCPGFSSLFCVCVLDVSFISSKPIDAISIMDKYVYLSIFIGVYLFVLSWAFIFLEKWLDVFSLLFFEFLVELIRISGKWISKVG